MIGVRNTNGTADIARRVKVVQVFSEINMNVMKEESESKICSLQRSQTMPAVMAVTASRATEWAVNTLEDGAGRSPIARLASLVVGIKMRGRCVGHDVVVCIGRDATRDENGLWRKAKRWKCWDGDRERGA